MERMVRRGGGIQVEGLVESSIIRKPDGLVS
jgi:hypothetical protein